LATGRIPTTANSPLTTKGDLFGYSTTQARVAVGSNGDTLVADSAATTGLRWQASQAAGKNGVINGGMDVWQRGTANVTTASVYTADRWQKSSNTAYGVSRQTTSDTTNLPNITYSLRAQRTNGSSSTTIIELNQTLENDASAPFIGQSVTLSFYARAGANFSASSSLLSAAIYGGTGTDQNLFSGMTGVTSLISAGSTLTTTWQRFQITGTITSTYKQIAVYFTYTPTGTAGANDWFELTGVQLELGSRATTFTRAGGTLQGELAACQRYYFRFNSNANEVLIPAGFANSTTAASGRIQYPVPMRVVPTSLDSANLQFGNYAGTTYAMTSVAYNQASNVSAQVYGTVTGTTAGHVGAILGSASNAYVGLNAEL
jgi:hypothetical protein